MTTTQPQQERRALNEGIESAYMDAAGLAASIKTHYQTGRGTIQDLYEDFYFNVAVLFELTSDLEEMKPAVNVSNTLQKWLDKEGISVGDKNFHEHCDEGMAVFKQYKIALSSNGLLALPQRGR